VTLHTAAPRRCAHHSRGLFGAGVFSLCLASTVAAAVATPIPLRPPTSADSAGVARGETARTTERGERVVTHVQLPSITPILPLDDGRPHAAVLVIPGGGHRELWIDHEGFRVAEFLAAHNVAGVVLKYRLAREPRTSLTIEGDELADVQRGLKLIRSRATEWAIDPARVGVIGFSAGGDLATLAAVRFDRGVPDAVDPVERLSARPDFAVIVYPGPHSDLVVPNDAPPSFLLCGSGDSPATLRGMTDLFQQFSAASVPVELHIYAGAGHGFGIRQGDRGPVAEWPRRMMEWLASQGFVDRP